MVGFSFFVTDSHCGIATITLIAICPIRILIEKNISYSFISRYSQNAHSQPG